MKILLIRSLFLLLLFHTFLMAQSVTLRLQWKHQFEFAGFYAALEKGFYQEAGLDVTLLEHDESVDSLDELLQGKVEFTTLYGNAILERQNGKPITLVANYLKRSPLALVVQPEILTPADLRGKKIMASREEMNSPHFQQLFNRYGIAEKDYTLYPVSFSVEEFVKKEVDAISVFLPNELFWLWEKNIPFGIIDPAHYGTVMLYDVNLVTSETFKNEKPDTVHAFRKASNRGWEYAITHKEEIVDLILAKYNTQNKSRKHLLFEADEIEKLMEPKAYGIGSIDLERIAQIEKLYIDLGESENFITPDTFVLKASTASSAGSEIRLTLEEKTFLKEHPVIRVSSEYDWPPMDFYEEGRPAGYSIEYMKLIEQKLGVKFEFVSDKWSTLVNKFKNRQIDVMHLFAHSKEREKYSLFIPYLKLPTHFIVRDGELEPTSIKDLYGKTAVVQKGWEASEKMKRRYPQLNYYEVDSTLEAYQAVAMGKADFLLDIKPVAYYIMEKNRLYNLKVAGIVREMSVSGVNIAVRKDWPELSGAIQKAMESIPLEKMKQLNEKWHVGNDTPGLLSLKEQAWLQQHGPITLCVDPLWQPIDFIDESGKHAGVGADFMKIFSQRIGQDIKLYPVKSWSEVLDAAQSRKCDIVSLMADTLTRQEYLSFTSPYFSSPNVIVTRDDVAYIEDVNKFENETFGVIRGYAALELLKEKYPKMKLIEVDSVKDGLRQVEENKIFGFIDIIPTIAWHIQQMGLVHLKISGNTGVPLHLGIGVRNDIPELHAILQKAVDSLSENEKETILGRYINVRYEQGFDYSLLWKIVGGFFLVLSGILFWNYKLNNRVREEVEKNRQQEKLLQFRERQAMIGEMMDAIIHQWKQPLHKINMVTTGTTFTVQQSEDLKTIKQQVADNSEIVQNQIRFMSDTTVNLRNFFSPDGKQTNFYIMESIKNTLKLFGFGLVQEKVNLTMSGDETLMAYGIENEFKQVILNLLKNSEEVLLERAVYEPKVSIKVLAQNSTSKVIFSDNGGGVEETQLKHIFNPYFTTRKEHGGSGIGLYLSKLIIEKMHGTIECTNTKSGCEFVITLPNHSDKQA